VSTPEKRSQSHYIPRSSSTTGSAPGSPGGADSPSMTGERCEVCRGRVYPTDKTSVEGKLFHRACFRCAHCKGVLRLGNFAALNGSYYCKPHFKQLFKRAGNYGFDASGGSDDISI